MNISEAAFELMDELFFMITFEDLIKETPYEDHTLIQLLSELLRAGWVDQLHIPEGELDFTKLIKPDLEQIIHYSYLATKKGLLAYNGIES